MRRYRSAKETRVSAAIRGTLKASGLTLRGFAQHLGISAAYLSDLCRGHRPLSAAQAERLSSQKPRRSVRDWLLLQMDDDIDMLKGERARIQANGYRP